MHALFRDGFADRDYMARYRRRARRARSASPRPHAAMGERHHRAQGRGDRGVRGARRATQAHVFPARLRLLAPAQRRGQHARRPLHPRRHRRLGARGRRRAACVERRLQARPDADRGSRRARREREAARPVARRFDPDRRPRGLEGRRAGQGDADPEHQSAGGRARPGAGAARLCPRGPVHLRARAVHDRRPRAMPTSCCRRRCSSSTTTSIRRARTSLSSSRAKTIDPPEGCRSNHEVISALAGRLGAEHRGFDMSPREIIDEILAGLRARNARRAGGRALARLPAAVRDRPFPRRLRASATASFTSAPTGRTCLTTMTASAVRGAICRPCPTIGRSTKSPTSAHPFKLATSPARNFLNSSFNETRDLARPRDSPERADASRRHGGAWA